jgi:glycosyltransferase involved in cell wall biosynthesis
MLNSELLLSIIIPTKNRYGTLNILISHLAKWSSQNFEIVIQDNSEDNTLFGDVLKLIKNDKRFQYNYLPLSMSAIENCNLAVKNSRGRYLCFIGDDDGIMEQSIVACEWMDRNKVDVLGCDKAGYTWPDMEHAISINNKFNGLLTINPFKGKLYQINSELELQKVIASGGQSMFRVPRLYHGFVAKSVLDSLHDLSGTYFPGPVPDMSNAVGIVPFVKKYYFTDIPLVVSGQSKNSMSGKNAVRKHQGEIKDEKSIPDRAAVEWSKEVPKYWSAPTIWAEAVIKALVNTNREERLKYFNYNNLYAHCFAFSNWRYYSRVLVAMKSNTDILKYIYAIIQTGILFVKISYGRFKNLLSKLMYTNNIIDSVQKQDIEAVMVFIQDKIEKKSVMDNFNL